MLSRSKAGLLTRRQFVAAGALGCAAMAIGCAPGKQGDWEFLSEDQARTLAAICDQIVPADEFPSASQAGVLTYIDRQLIRHYRRHQDAYRDGLEQAEAMSRKRFGKELAPSRNPSSLRLSAPSGSRTGDSLSWCATTPLRATTARRATAAIATP